MNKSNHLKYMKFLQRLLFLFAFLLVGIGLSAQDLSQRTLYNMMPLSVNPAYTGDFEGTFRVGGMYKDQHSSTFKTPSFFVDVPIIMVRKRDWLSAGVSFDSDRAGSLGFSTTRSLLSASYHLSLDKKAKSYLVLGYQFGSDNVKIKDLRDETIILENPNDNQISNIDPMNGQSNSINNIGLMYRSAIDKNTNLNIGLAYNYVIKQDGSATSGGGGQTGGGGGSFKRPSKIIFHGLIDRKLNDKLSIHPSFIFRSRGNEGSEIMVQAMAGYLFKEDIDLTLKGGIGYDVDEGPAVLLGADYGDWKFGLSFDLPIYGVAEATSFGGFEISVNRIFKIYKKPTVKPTICCPDL
jgi:type IX secretion system PorP/SprF family membrane protein